MQIVRVLKKFRQVLSRHQKKRIVELGVLMVIGGFLEMFSVSLILPFMNVVMEPEKIMKNELVSYICDVLGLDSSRSFLCVLAIVLGVVFLLKNAFLLLEYSVQYRFVYGNMIAMQERLLSNLIHRPYEFFLKVDSGEIIRIINSDTFQSFSLLSVLLGLFTELVVSSMMIIAVFIIAPIITIVIAIVLLLMVGIINFVIKPIMRRAGRETQKSSSGMNKWLLQSIQGIKELKVSSKEDFFLERFNRYGEQYVVAVRKSLVFESMPRFIIEAVGMCTIFGVVSVMIYKGVKLETIVPIITAVAMVSIRLLPSINRITSSLGSISYREPMLDKLIENLQDINGAEYGDLRQPLDMAAEASRYINGFEKSIQLMAITYRYPNSEIAVLDNVNMIVKKGQSVGIIGSSGAGKTTAVDVLLGFLRPEQGRVLLDGVDIKDDMPGFLSQVGYIPQSIFMLNGTIRENVAFGENHASDDGIWKALSDASLEKYVRRLPEGLDTEIGERGVRLSGGQIQRIGIARALYRNPSILVFDEATSALDNETEREIMDSIENLRGTKTMIIIAHRLTTIEKCDVIYRVEEGKIVLER